MPSLFPANLRPWRPALSIFLPVVLLMALTGCQGTDGQGTSLSKVQESGELRIGTEGTYRPFTFNENNTLTGYDVDVARAVAETMGLKPSFQQTQFDALFAGLDGNRFDVIANQVAISPERKVKYDFSAPYTVSKGVIVTHSTGPSITSFDQLQGKRTAQSPTSNWYKLAKDKGAQVAEVEGWSQAVALLKQGRVDAVINDELTFLDYQKTSPDKDVNIAASIPETSSMAFVARKENEKPNQLVGAINDALDKLRKDGTLTQISEKYFGTDVSQ